MPRAHLRETIARMRQELDSGEPLSSEELDALSGVLGEIEGLLESEESEPGENTPLIEKLLEAETKFADSHPKLTTSVRAVVNALSRLGI